MQKIFQILTLVIFSMPVSIHGQQIFHTNPSNDAQQPCVTAKEYAQIEKQIIQNRKVLGLDKPAGKNATFTTILQWPLRLAANLDDCGYYYISAYVDLNIASGSVQDWNCGTRTYDGHRGIDIVGWPFIWDKMDNNSVEVIAAATGTIITKVDGNFDRVCNPTGSEASNYITIQHSDGSTALYVHLKSGTMTAKTVGQTVDAGEYLGSIGSAGVSTGAHLHFEIRSDGTFNNYIDPSYGTCNTGIGSSWWANQKPYEEPEILKLSLHTSWAYMGVCPNTVDTLYEEDTFISTPGAQAYFQVFSKNVTAGMSWDFKILNPDNTTFASWDFTSATYRLSSWLGWPKALPTMPGIYTFQGVFNGITCTKMFTIQSATSAQNINASADILLFPNPSGGKVFLTIGDPILLKDDLHLKVYNSMGQTVWNTSIFSATTELDFKLPCGLYFYSLTNKNEQLKSGKLLLNQ